MRLAASLDAKNKAYVYRHRRNRCATCACSVLCVFSKETLHLPRAVTDMPDAVYAVDTVPVVESAWQSASTNSAAVSAMSRVLVGRQLCHLP